MVSESRREVLQLVPAGEHGTSADGARWADRAAAHLVATSPILARQLSDLFEATGASATSSRFDLDRSWRDFTARQAAFPTNGGLAR